MQILNYSGEKIQNYVILTYFKAYNNNLAIKIEKPFSCPKTSNRIPGYAFCGMQLNIDKKIF